MQCQYFLFDFSVLGNVLFQFSGYQIDESGTPDMFILENVIVYILLHNKEKIIILDNPRYIIVFLNVIHCPFVLFKNKYFVLQNVD
jgi:hypothetical protein